MLSLLWIAKCFCCQPPLMMARCKGDGIDQVVAVATVGAIEPSTPISGSEDREGSARVIATRTLAAPRTGIPPEAQTIGDVVGEEAAHVDTKSGAWWKRVASGMFTSSRLDGRGACTWLRLGIHGRRSTDDVPDTAAPRAR